MEDKYATDAEITAARVLHQSEVVEIDEGAEVSHGNDGYWVQAWVFVPEADDSEEEDEEETNGSQS